MAEPKPFDATPNRVARAKREGDVARSSELVAAFALVGGSGALALVAAPATGAVYEALVEAARGSIVPGAFATLAWCALAPCVASGACAAAGTVLASGGVHPRPMRFDLSKMLPGSGIKRMFSLRSCAAALRAVLASALVCGALERTVREAFLSGPVAGTTDGFIVVGVRAAQTILATAACTGLALGILDALYERTAWRRRLRMTFDEMKRDLKESEGDPQLRGRRRAHHRSLIRGSLSRLSDATFVVANPTHVAVALEYRPPLVAVPRVLIRAVDAGAHLVRTRARALGIPIIEDVALARMLLATTRVDDVIPRACYLAVARIVARLDPLAGSA
jgi:flagellar biosynthesis protein FlhB